MILVGKVLWDGEIGFLIRLRVGSFLASYVGLPLGAFYKSHRAWNLVDECFKRRLAFWKKNMSKEGRMTTLKGLFNVFQFISCPYLSSPGR